MVASAYRLEGGYEEIKRLCYAGLDEFTLIQHTIDRLQRVVPFVSYCVHVDDPLSGLMTRVVVDQVMTEKQHRLYMEQIYFDEDYYFIRGMVRARATVQLLSDLTCGKLERAARYRVINGPLGLEHELISVCLTGRELWGGMCLIREKGRPDFDEPEAQFVRQIAPHIGAGLKMASLRTQGPAPDDTAAGVLILDERARVIRHTDVAERWMREMPDFGPRWKEGYGLPTPVWMVVGALRRALAPQTEAERNQVPRIIAQTRSGQWLTFHGSQTFSDGGQRSETTVIVEPSRPRELAWLRGAAYGLSERERAVVELVVQGASTKQIARELHVSEYTVQEHLSNVFDKVGVRGRQALVRRPFFDQLAPGLTASLGDR